MKLCELNALYFSDKAECCRCGCHLEDNTGNGIGSVFVLDKHGRFYCMNCDSDFEDGDERIFDSDLYPEEECGRDYEIE